MRRHHPIDDCPRRTQARSGSLSVEICVALSGVALAVVLLGSVAASRRRAVELERRSADLETAQNLLPALRAGERPALPQGWTLAFIDLAGRRVLELRAPSGARLRTLEEAP